MKNERRKGRRSIAQHPADDPMRVGKTLHGPSPFSVDHAPGRSIMICDL
jgi:hypothetical protein